MLFHYNGHGVPKPTANGEIWVFNRSYTQYIPLSLYDLQAWMGSPSIYVYDCSNAGIIVSCFDQFAEQHDRENFAQVRSYFQTHYYIFVTWHCTPIMRAPAIDSVGKAGKGASRVRENPARITESKLN